MPRSRRIPASVGGWGPACGKFGTWRDKEGRLVWGVNDCDEAARMPYAVDLMRLVTSAILAQSENRIRY